MKISISTAEALAGQTMREVRLALSDRRKAAFNVYKLSKKEKAALEVLVSLEEGIKKFKELTGLEVSMRYSDVTSSEKYVRRLSDSWVDENFPINFSAEDVANYIKVAAVDCKTMEELQIKTFNKFVHPYKI